MPGGLWAQEESNRSGPPDGSSQSHGFEDQPEISESLHRFEEEHGKDDHDPAESLGADLPVWSVLPFIGILLSIALMPLLTPRFWHHWFPLVSAFWALSFVIPFLWIFGEQAWHDILHIYLIDYIPFIILLWGLYTVSGGILIEGTLKGTPALNSVILIFGTLIASWIGTTGASMLLIRPVLRANAWRERKVHVIIFFIFLVSNVGGSLTPLGDPPLFLGFLHGVPFFWTFNLFPQMAFVAVILLALFFLIDCYHYRRENKDNDPSSEERTPLRILGLHNVIFLMGVVGAVLFSGLYELGHLEIMGVHMAFASLVRDGFIILMGLGSLWTTKRIIRKKNQFTWFPIKEVAYLFAGIFATIVPALAILKAGQDGALGFIIEQVKRPTDYFWITGILSSFLDNAPTYLTFLNTALGTFFANLPEKAAVMKLIEEQSLYLLAISIGAVFMGANTYIGNAPNFMVKAIAVESGVPMPSFFGYILKYSLPILIPTFILVTMTFFA
jgi:Na+/H+ antiporter NhaD/arsenite permease-like protein